MCIWHMPTDQWTLWPPLNDVFEWDLALEDEGYDSGIESLSIPIPVHKVLCLYHISASENLSFGPATPWAYSP